MKHQHAFTLMELALVIVIVLSIIGLTAIVLPLLGAARDKGSRRTVNAMHLRGIHVGLVLFSRGNNSYYPGVRSDGVSIDSNIGLTTQGRIGFLIEENYITPDYETNPMEEPAPMTSYALLQVNINVADNTSVPQDGRNMEWRETNNPDAILISDRAVPMNHSYDTITSVYAQSDKGKQRWQGYVGWNDNHVTFESTSYLPTRYGKKSHLIDALFASPGDAHVGDDAFMVWNGTNSL